jgi:hypothetical protein
VLSEKLSAPKVEVEVESEAPEGEKCADCGSESCTCEE